MKRPIFLLTDFGTRDPFVGIMKAVLWSFSPESAVIDLTHRVPRQNILRGAMYLEDSLPSLPEDAVVLAVVDPGVGTDRKPLAALARDRFFVGPDNGLFDLVFRQHKPEELFTIRPGGRIPPLASATFHGRDIFAPAAGLIAAGKMPHHLGQKTDSWVRLDFPAPRLCKDREGIELVVVNVDHFGNATLNVRQSEIATTLTPPERSELRLSLTNGASCRIHRKYADVPRGELLAYWNAFGRLELAVNGGSAAHRHGLVAGTKVILHR